MAERMAAGLTVAGSVVVSEVIRTVLQGPLVMPSMLGAITVAGLALLAGGTFWPRGKAAK